MLEHLPYVEGLGGMGLLGQETRMSLVMGGSKVEGARLFSGVPMARTRGKGHESKPGKVHENIRKRLLTVRMTEPWRRWPGKVMESPSLGMFGSHLDTVPGSQLLVTSLEPGLGPDDLQRSLPP